MDNYMELHGELCITSRGSPEAIIRRWSTTTIRLTRGDNVEFNDTDGTTRKALNHNQLSVYPARTKYSASSESLVRGASNVEYN